MGSEQMASIRRLAEGLYGSSLGDAGDLLVSIAAQRALAYCNRRDIPAEMEQAVAALTVLLAGGGQTVKALTRGDTAFTFDTAGTAGLEGLALLDPWRRLGTVRREEVTEP